MNKNKHIPIIIKRIWPVLLITVTAYFLCILAYNKLIEKEERESWSKLDLASQSIAEQMNIRLNAQLNLLHNIGNAIILNDEFEFDEGVFDYLNSVQQGEGNLFDRIDLVLPDGIQICQDGHRHKFVGIDTFEEMAARGLHISPRLADDHTGDEVVYLGAPLIKNGDTVAILMGMINCDSLAKEFISRTYEGKAKLYLIDCKDGNYLIDANGRALANIYNEAVGRSAAKGYESVNFEQDIEQAKSGKVAFYVEALDSTLYASYTPVEDFRWMVIVMVEEDIIFESVYALKDLLFIAAFIVTIFLLLYILWNSYVINNSIRNEELAERAEVEHIKNEAKSLFLSTMSHDIRTPLNGIIGMLDVIKHHDNVPEETQKALHKIETSARYLETLANDVLDFNAIESGKFKLQDDSINIIDFIKDLEPMIQSRIYDSGIHYSTDFSELVHPKVRCSAVHLQRILMNLITNAIKYNKIDGHVRVSVSEAESKDGRATYDFIVADTGIGMSEEFQREMFGAFEQENAGARSKNRGHGLGLSIVKRLVDKMEGSITVESKKDEGTVFLVTLTFDLDDSSDSSSEVLPMTPTAALEGVQVLLVEDNELNMEIANILLVQAGGTVGLAHNGREAVDMFSESEPNFYDIILMDIMMPVMDGIEACKAIRDLSRPDALSVPIVAMSATNFTEDIDRFIRSGMNDHISKPINMDILIQKILQYTKNMM